MAHMQKTNMKYDVFLTIHQLHSVEWESDH